MKLRIVQRTQDRVWGCATAPLDDGEAEFIAGSPSADFEECPGLLDNLPSGRTVLQEFRPLPESLYWELGHCFWQHLGVQSFLGGRVPYRVTNDGNLSRKAATVLFDSLSAAAAGQPIDPNIRVLELGAGSGLFARHFLDEFQALCQERGRDYYDRLLYLVTDASTRMRADLARHGVLSAHEGRYRIEAANAEAPGFGLSNSVVRETDGEGKFHAVILNYVLDCLPATVLKVSDGEVSELFVRTSLARNVDLAAHTSMNAEELVACARSADPAERTRLLELYPLFALEHQYRSAARERIPFAAQAVETAGPDEGVVLHNHGALLCLERVLTLLAPGGFALINDYDDSPFDEFVQSYRHQHFGGSVAFGLNQALLRKHFSARDDCQWIETAGENRPLASRLLARDPDPTTVRAFRRCFSTPAHDWHSSPIEQARGFAKAGRRESAHDAQLRQLSLARIVVPPAH